MDKTWCFGGYGRPVTNDAQHILKVWLKNIDQNSSYCGLKLRYDKGGAF